MTINITIPDVGPNLHPQITVLGVGGSGGNAVNNMMNSNLEGVEFLSCYPTTPILEAAAAAGIRPVICRQERVGVGIADGFSVGTWEGSLVGALVG